MSAISIPPAAEILQAVRESCHDLRVASRIEINDASIEKFLLDLDEAAWNADKSSARHGIRLPLRFDSPVEELNIIAVLSLLNFLSGYRTALHRLTTRGAWSTVLALVLSAHLSSSSSSDSPLSTKGMLASTPASLAALAQIKTHNEEPHPTLGPAVTMGVKDDEAFEILELVSSVLKETGGVLRKAGKKDLGEWVKDALVETEGETGAMLVKIVTAFPAFRDAGVVDGKPVYLFKKALFLLNAISDRFSPSSLDPTTSTPPFPVPNPQVSPLPIFADNVIPTMLVHHSILTLSTSTDASLSSPSPSSARLSPASALRLRAAAVDCCVSIVAHAHALSATHPGKEWLKDLTEVDLDGWLWSTAKEGENREIERFAESGTVFY